MSLRRRLIVALVAVALTVIGSIAAELVILRTSLHNQLNRELFAATRELVSRASPRAGDRSSEVPTQLTDLVVGDLAASGQVATARPAGGSDELPRLPPEIVRAHATDPSAPIEPFDAAAGGGDRYRVAAVRVADDRIVVAALPTEHVDATVRRFAFGSAIVAAALLTAMALVAWWVERLGLRPIRNVAAAADAIASGEITRRVEPPSHGTEAGDLAVAFNLMVDERLAAEDRLRQFVADASHELRTPLTTIAGVHQLFASGLLAGAELGEAMRRAGAEAERMTRLVEDLLLLAQLDHGRPLGDDEVDLAVLIRDAAVDIGLVQPERPVTVDSAGMAVVRGDEERLRQVVSNLVANALIHTSPHAAVHLAVSPADGGYVIEVGDRGPGLTAEQVKHVFDRFYRVAAGRDRHAGGGTGLGLSIVQSIVAAHRGRVSVTAGPDQGCCFRVMLPADFQQTSSILSSQAEVDSAPSSHDEQTQTEWKSTGTLDGRPR